MTSYLQNSWKFLSIKNTSHVKTVKGTVLLTKAASPGQQNRPLDRPRSRDAADWAFSTACYFFRKTPRIISLINFA